MREPGSSYFWLVPLVRFPARIEKASLSRMKKTACVTLPSVAPATGFSRRPADSGPSAKLSSTTERTQLLLAGPVAKKSSVVEQLKSVPFSAVPAIATCTVASAANDRFTGKVTADPPSSATTREEPNDTEGGVDAALTVTVMETGEQVPSLSVAVNENSFAPICADSGRKYKYPLAPSKSQTFELTAVVQAYDRIGSPSVAVAVTVYSKSTFTVADCAAIAPRTGGVPGTPPVVATLPVGEFGLLPAAFTARARK